jgi:hypothetical protein
LRRRLGSKTHSAAQRSTRNREIYPPPLYSRAALLPPTWYETSVVRYYYRRSGSCLRRTRPKR